MHSIFNFPTSSQNRESHDAHSIFRGNLDSLANKVTNIRVENAQHFSISYALSSLILLILTVLMARF